MNEKTERIKKLFEINRILRELILKIVESKMAITVIEKGSVIIGKLIILVLLLKKVMKRYLIF